jgi:hypothetical protein
MKYTLEKCEGHICIKTENGIEISKWKDESIERLGGLEKILDRINRMSEGLVSANKIKKNIEINIVEKTE